MIKAIAFDLEGTIVNNDLAHHRAIAMATAEFTGVRLFKKGTQDYEPDYKKFFAVIPGFIGLSNLQVAQQFLRLREHADGSIYLSNEEPYSGRIQEFIHNKDHNYGKYIQEHGFDVRTGFFMIYVALQSHLQIRFGPNFAKNLCIGTALPWKKAEQIVNRFVKPTFAQKKIEEIFVPFRLMPDWFSRDQIVTESDYIGRPKPSPDIWFATAKKSKVQPYEQLIFEDSVRGVTSAVSSGATVIAVASIDEPGHLKKLQEAGAYYVCASWLDQRLKTEILPKILART